MRALTTSLILAAVVASTTGCDDVIGYDVASDGRLLVAVDGAGRVAATGDGKTPRWVMLVDPESGVAERLTETPRAVTWLAACEGGAVCVEDRTTLLFLASGEERVLCQARSRRLYQPQVSPSGARVSVLVADGMGRPGVLYVLDTLTGEAVAEPLDDALLGGAWVGETFVTPVARGGREGAFEPGPGALVALDGGAPRVLFEGPLSVLTLVAAAGPEGMVATLPRATADGALELVHLTTAGELERGEATAIADLWPAVAPGGREVLFTRSRPGFASFEGELRVAALDDLSRSRLIRTPGPVSSPRWLGADRVAYLTPGDRLVVQPLDGGRPRDLTASLRASLEASLETQTPVETR